MPLPSHVNKQGWGCCCWLKAHISIGIIMLLHTESALPLERVVAFYCCMAWSLKCRGDVGQIWWIVVWLRSMRSGM